MTRRFPGRGRPGLVVAALAVASTVACELDERTVAPGTPVVVLHAVLSPTTARQSLLLERSWDGVNYIWKTGQLYSQADPVTYGSGFAEVLAQIDVTTPSGTVVRAREARLVDPSMGGGVYWLTLPPGSLGLAGGSRLIS